MWERKMILKIDHIGVVVRDIEEALKVYRDVLGLKVSHVEVMEEAKVKLAFLPVGEVMIELLEPTDGEIGEFLEREGEGFHHIAFKVENIREMLSRLKEAGIKLQDEEPRKGSRGTLIAFLDPESTMGIRIELVQES